MKQFSCESTIHNLLLACIKKLTASIENPRNEAEQILQYILGVKNRSELYLLAHKTVSRKHWEKAQNLIEKRSNGEPLQYILGTAYFWNLPLEVNQYVLIPRPETELIVEYVVNQFSGEEEILDMGTGSGCIAIALKKVNPFFKTDAVDVSRKALNIAEKNAKNNNVKIHFYQSNLFSNVQKQYDIIISNPPYIAENEYEQLAFEIKNYEPRQALIAGKSGLDFYENILRDAKPFLKKNGIIVLEIGAEQALQIKKLAKKYGFLEMYVKKDLNDYDRMMIIK